MPNSMREDDSIDFTKMPEPTAYCQELDVESGRPVGETLPDQSSFHRDKAKQPETAFLRPVPGSFRA
jgi:hypothetical protein